MTFQKRHSIWHSIWRSIWHSYLAFLSGILIWHSYLAFLSGILSGIPSGILIWHSYLAFFSGILSGTLSDVLSGILIWHSCLAFYLAFHLAFLSYLAFFSGILSGTLSDVLIWHSYLAFFSGILSGTLSDVLSGILSFISFGILSGGWGPAGNTWRGFSRLRSGREHWAWMVAVAVRQGTLGVDGRGWGPEEAEGGRRRKSSDIKSNNPHLTWQVGKKLDQTSDLSALSTSVLSCTTITTDKQWTHVVVFICLELHLLGWNTEFVKDFLQFHNICNSKHFFCISTLAPRQIWLTNDKPQV